MFISNVLSKVKTQSKVSSYPFWLYFTKIEENYILIVVVFLSRAAKLGNFTLCGSMSVTFWAGGQKSTVRFPILRRPDSGCFIHEVSCLLGTPTERRRRNKHGVETAL